MVHATGAGGAGLQNAQERSGPSADPSSTGTSRRGAHPGGVPGLLPERDAADETPGVGARPHARASAAIPVGDPDAGGANPHDRWANAGAAASHRAAGAAEVDPGEVGPDAAASAP